MDRSSDNQHAARLNRLAWDQMAREKQRFTRAASDEEFAHPMRVLNGDGWLGSSIHGKSLLCLGAGGGRHGPLYAAAGARVTVVDVSPAQLQLDREVAGERRLNLRTVETSMDDLSMFASGEFEIVIHPVSTCYLPDVQSVFAQVAHVLTAGGLYISQHKQPTSLQTEVTPRSDGYTITEPYYRDGALPRVAGSLHREEGTCEYLHRWEQLIGGMCRAGFVIEDLVEPRHADVTARPGAFAHRSLFVAPYVRIKARRGQNSSPWSVGHGEESGRVDWNR